MSRSANRQARETDAAIERAVPRFVRAIDRMTGPWAAGVGPSEAPIPWLMQWWRNRNFRARAPHVIAINRPGVNNDLVCAGSLAHQFPASLSNVAASTAYRYFVTQTHDTCTQTVRLRRLAIVPSTASRLPRKSQTVGV